MNEWKYVVIVTIVLIVMYFAISSQQKGGAPADPQLQNVSGPFSGIGSFIGDGVCSSWDNKPNGPDRKKPQLNPTDQPLMTYYGHGIPLDPSPPGDFDGMPITPHNLNPKCAPECCPSPYSCDHGCLCIDQDGMRDAAWASAKN